MRITSSDLTLKSRSRYGTSLQEQQKLSIWTDGSSRPPLQSSDSLSLSPRARELSLRHSGGSNSMPAGEEKTNLTNDPRIEKIRRVLEMLTGKKIDSASYTPSSPSEPPHPAPAPYHASNLSPPTAERQGWGIVLEQTNTYEERQELAVQAIGSIQLEDGETLGVNFALEMERQFTSVSSFSLRAGDALLDPLVLYFEDAALEGRFSQITTSLDLDGDGRQETFSFAPTGSGFLAHDHNGNGTVDVGSELFGPTSGYGFKELARLDTDNNGWIDENDPAFKSLSLWSLDSEGKPRLTPIAAQGVGAIYIDHIDAAFSFKDNTNTLQAEARKAGLFLREDKTAGLLQQIDLAV